jgi:hypothetical protein
VGFVDFMTAVQLKWHGMGLFPTASWFATFPVRPHALLVSADAMSPSRGFSYWFRPHTAEGKVPVVFLHGLGIGLYPYVSFIGEVAKEAGEGVGILVIEIMVFIFSHNSLGDSSLLIVRKVGFDADL